VRKAHLLHLLRQQMQVHDSLVMCGALCQSPQYRLDSRPISLRSLHVTPRDTHNQLLQVIVCCGPRVSAVFLGLVCRTQCKTSRPFTVLACPAVPWPAGYTE
jgi:hypothetical protein